MKKISDFKSLFSYHIKRLSKEKIAIFICIPLSLIALSICAILLLGADKSAPSDTDKVKDTVTQTERRKETYAYPSNSPYSLEFESLGDGLCAISGIGGFTEKELKIPKEGPNGEKIVAINEKAFYNCDTLESVFISASIEKIGAAAFRGCSSLAYVGVDMNNEHFCSVGGVLFSKGKSRLIFYPPNRGNDKYYLSEGIKQIDAFAFEGAKNLSVILYSKGTAEFEKIDIGKGNETLLKLPITCNYEDGK